MTVVAVAAVAAVVVAAAAEVGREAASCGLAAADFEKGKTPAIASKRRTSTVKEKRGA